MIDYETIQRRRNIIVGIFVVVALIALAYLVYQFGDLPVFVSKFKSFKVAVQFPTAQGVQRDTPVRFCGYQIGRVTDVRHPKVMKDLKTGRFYHQTLTILAIDRRYSDIPADVEARLMTRGLGSSSIELELTRFDVNEPMGPTLTNGSILQGSTGVTSEFFPQETQKKFDELVSTLRVLMDNANDIIGDPNNKENIKKTLANLSEASQQAKKTMEEFSKFADTGTTTFEQLTETTAQLRLILEKMNTGQGTAARFLNDGKFYENLLENTQQIQLLLEELRVFLAEAREKGLPLRLKK